MSAMLKSQKERRAAKRLRVTATVMFVVAVAFAASSPMLLAFTESSTWWVPLTSALIIACSGFSALDSAQTRDRTAALYEQRGL